MDITLEMPNEPRNNITSAKKLELALEMAASIADLHGFSGGVIVHSDIQLRQWLQQSPPDGKLILGDFNLAQVSWDDEKESYCKFKRGRGLGNVSYNATHSMIDYCMIAPYNLFPTVSSS